MLRHTTNTGYLKKTQVLLLTEAAGEGVSKMSPRLGKQMDLLRDTAESLKFSAKHEDDTRALHDFGMMVGVLGKALSEFGWKAEAHPMVALSQKLMKAAKDQGIEDRY